MTDASHYTCTICRERWEGCVEECTECLEFVCERCYSWINGSCYRCAGYESEVRGGGLKMSKLAIGVASREVIEV